MMDLEKEKLIEKLKQQGFSEKIIEAFSKVRKEDFIPETFQLYAYEDIALPIQDGTMVPKPSTIAFILSLLDLHYGQKVLEIGSGSGYVCSLISEIIKNGKIIGLEINRNLANNSRKLLEKDSNITIINQSGWNGFLSEAPYDRILISAACNDHSTIKKISEQLKPKGILVSAFNQSLIQINTEKKEEKIFEGYSFVPLKRDA